ncbi:unnamed protein product [Parajaminaea phylloscopi]
MANPVDVSAASSSSMHLNFPTAAYGAPLNSRSISRVSVHPAALFSILDHYLRRNDAKEGEGEADAAEAKASPDGSGNAQPNRVIGTLLGTHNDNEVEIRSCFAVPHNETDELVQVDMDYHRSMIELHSKVHPEEVIVGWYVPAYATSPTLNTYSALIQDFFSRESAPNQAVHLTIDADVSRQASNGREPLGVQAYVSSPLGHAPKAENAVFVPLPVTLLSTLPERPALSLLASQTATSQDGVAAPQVAAGQIVPDLTALTQSLQQVQGQLRRVLSYVRDVTEGKVQGDEVVGRHLLDTIARIPIGASTAEGKDVSEIWNSSLQDVLMVSYLSNIVRAQAEVASRLTLLS